MIAAWQVVAVLVPLCSVSGITGYAYARRLAQIEYGPVGVPAVTSSPEKALTAFATPRRSRPVEDQANIDLVERLQPFWAVRDDGLARAGVGDSAA